MIIDAHSHLWLRQDTEVDGMPIRTLDGNGSRSLFFGEVRQMMPPFMIDGKNTAEVFLSNMDYAQVAGAVVVQEFIDGQQNDYLAEVRRTHPDRFRVCCMPDFMRPDFLTEAKTLIESGSYDGLAIPGHRLARPLNDPEMMQMYDMLLNSRTQELRNSTTQELNHGMFLSLCLHEDNHQLAEVEDIIATYPDLRIAIGHFGMVTTDGWLEQIRLARHPNVMVESGGITWLFNSEFYPYDGAIRAIRQAADLVGMDKLMWGSDYPRTITAITYRMSYDFVSKSPALTDREKALFLGENARRFYNFNPQVDLPYIKNMSE